MPKRKEGVDEMLIFLSEEKGLPALASRGQVCDALGIGRDHLSRLIIKGKITLDENKIPIGSVARYLCG